MELEFSQNQNQDQSQEQIIEELKQSSWTLQQLLDWAEKSTGWQGEDFDYCLEIVRNSRTPTQFQKD